MIPKASPALFSHSALQAVAVVAFALLLANVSAVVDAFLHPEIPYFDREHLIVGGVTAFTSLFLLSLMLNFMHRLRRARERIDRLEAMLPICANCKRIRKTGSDPRAIESWQTIESYITEKTKTEFSHGICPECRASFYLEHERVPEGEQHRDS